ncbi:MAG: beta-propeller fold lactonase family protein, partial [Chthoniobacterales bacterium]
SPYDTGVVFPEAYTTDPAGRLFLTNFGSGDVRVYTTADGVPTEVAGSPFAISGLSGAMDGLLHPAGFYLVADRAGDQVGVYQISGSGNSTTMAAVAGSPFTSGGTVTDALALSQSGRYLFVGNGTSRNITTFLVDPTTGALNTVTTQPADTLGGSDNLLSSLAYFQPQGSLLYVLNSNSTANRIFGYRVNETYGSLAPIFGFPIETGGTGVGVTFLGERLAFDRIHNRLFALNDVTPTVSGYRVDPVSGFLTELPFSPFAVTPATTPALALHPSGSPLLVSDFSGESRVT